MSQSPNGRAPGLMRCKIEVGNLVETCLASTESWVRPPAPNWFVCCTVDWTGGLRNIRQVLLDLVKLKFLTKDTTDTRNEELSI